jgi:hypothetical protein
VRFIIGDAKPHETSSSRTFLFKGRKFWRKICSTV